MKKTDINIFQSLLLPIYNWRYWPTELLYLPLTLYIFFIGSIKAGRLFYFAAANPRVPLGGFANDSKFYIIENIPDAYKPKTILILKNDTVDKLKFRIQEADFQFPIFAKPDIGEGGFLAKKISSWNELLNYHSKHNMDYLVQEFIPYPLELSILIHNANDEFNISSITERKHLSITGDGYSNLEKLLRMDNIARYRISSILNKCENQRDTVLEKGQTIKPTAIGNRNYGATFIERSELLNNSITESFGNLNKSINLFNYARYDIMCTSIEDFLQGQMKILEINGVKGEPIHIYDRKYSLLGAYKEIFKHWNLIMKISKRNIKDGFVCPSIKNGFCQLRNHYITKKKSLTNRKFHE